MASLETFESVLRDVVQARRLSASKVKELTGITMKLIKEDTQLVSVLYRTHMSLPAPTAKVHSLYAIDALARAAHGQVTKHGISGDSNTHPGNCATFLLKLEGVLDGIFQDMLASAGAEGKEKTKKILDIWIKAKTFPSALLTRLSGILTGAAADKVTDSVNSTTPSGAQSQPTPATTTPPAASQVQAAPGPTGADLSLQSKLLALLSQAANVGQPNGQTVPNTSPIAPAAASGPQLDANSLALFQHLTQTANLGIPGPSTATIIPSTSSVSPPPPPSYPIHTPAVHPGPSQQPPLLYQEDRFDGNHREPRYSRHDAPPNGRDLETYHDDRHEFRGRFRGGFRGRGRGRWDDRHRDHERERSPVPKGRRSRSRSPPRSRYGGRRDVKPYSPPHRPSLVAVDSQRASEPPTSNAGKDEFGRDIRPTEDKGSDQEARSPRTSVSVSTDAEAHVARAESYHSPVVQESPPSASTANPGGMHGHDMGPAGLASFDLTTFDPTAPASWEALGKAWQTTYGYSPGQEELMTFVMNGMASAAATASQPQANQPPVSLPQADSWGGPGWRGRGMARGGWRGGRGGRGGFQPRGGPVGRGRYGYGNVREGQERPAFGGNAYAETTDAIVLGGNDAEQAWDSGVQETQQMTIGRNGAMGIDEGPSAGKMQRVGGQWQFVRSDALS